MSSPSLFSNTGRTDFRLTEVQQPNVTATLSWSRSCLAFSAKRSQFDAGSTITGSIFLPMTPPLALISSKAIMHTSRSDTSLIAIVPESECSTPTLTVPLGAADRRKPEARGGGADAHCRRRLRKSLRGESLHACLLSLRGEWVQTRSVTALACRPSGFVHLAASTSDPVVSARRPCSEQSACPRSLPLFSGNCERSPAPGKQTAAHRVGSGLIVPEKAAGNRQWLIGRR